MKKSMVKLGGRSVALVDESESTQQLYLKTSKGNDSSAVKNSQKSIAEESEAQQLLKSELQRAAEERRTRQAKKRTYRIWHPQQQNKGIVVQIGNEENEDKAKEVFDTGHMKKNDFQDWKRQANAVLPSNTGAGAPIEKLEKVVEAAPEMQKEDVRAVGKTLRRLSLESERKPPPPPIEKKPEKSKADPVIIKVIDVDEGSDSDSDSDEEDYKIEKKKMHVAGKDIRGKIQTLKELAEHLVHKRKIRQMMVKTATGHTILDAEEIPLKEHLVYMAQLASDSLKDLWGSLELWKRDIREINGRFGFVIASYFIWLRRILILNIFCFFVTLTCIIIPQFLEDQNIPSIHQVHIEHPERTRKEFVFGDIFTAEGPLHEYSYFFYASYHPRIHITNNPFTSVAFRFLFAITIIFILNTYFFFSRISKYYRTVRMATQMSGLANDDHFKGIICAWDYSCGNPKAAVSLRKMIYHELHYLVKAASVGKHRVETEAELKGKRVLAFLVRKLGVLWGPRVMHALTNLCVLACCFIQGCVLYALCNWKWEYYYRCIPNREDDRVHVLEYNSMCPMGDLYLQSLIFALPSLFASVTALILSWVIVRTEDMEIWMTADSKIYATMTRASAFYFTNITVFYAYWIPKKEEILAQGFVPETLFGKELYRLVVTQGILDVTLNLGVVGAYHFYRVKVKKQPDYKKPEFHAETCALQMFYTHCLGVLGTLSCPGICFFVALRLVLDFYQYRISLYYLSHHETYAAHASAVYTPYLLIFFFCYLFTSYLNLYYLTNTRPSALDGPFQLFKNSYTEAVTEVLNEEPNLKWLNKMGEPGFLITTVVILGALAYFCRQWSRAYKPIHVQLNEFIIMEREDREFLLKAIFEIGKVTNDFSKLKGPASTGKTKSVELKKSRDRLDDISRHHRTSRFEDEIDNYIKQVQQRQSPGTDTKSAPQDRLTDNHKARKNQYEAMVKKLVQDSESTTSSSTASSQPSKTNINLSPNLI